MSKKIVTLDHPEIKKAIEQEGGSVVIDYKGYILVAPRRHLIWTMNSLRERPISINTLIKKIDKNLVKITVGKHTEKQIKNFMSDVVIWYANEIIEGRQSLEPQ